MRDGAHHRRILLAGASGTIGRAVVSTLIADGHELTCLLRDSAGGREVSKDLRAEGAKVHFVDLADAASLSDFVSSANPETIVSCIASRSGSPKDAQAVDYRANANLLAAAECAGAEHFILLSAICVQRPRLAFQHAKLAFEKQLMSSAIDHTIVRPTAFFKSLSGQVERVAKGGPFMVFADGKLTRCKPISDSDLARFIADRVADPERRNTVLPIGGPGPAISLRDQGEILFEVAGAEPRFRSVPPGLFLIVARMLSLAAPFSDWFAEKAEYARIAHYYATESMLVLDPETGEYSADMTPEFGEHTLRDHYRQLLGRAR